MHHYIAVNHVSHIIWNLTGQEILEQSGRQAADDDQYVGDRQIDDEIVGHVVHVSIAVNDRDDQEVAEHPG